MSPPQLNNAPTLPCVT